MVTRRPRRPDVCTFVLVHACAIISFPLSLVPVCDPQFLLIAALVAVAAAQHGKGYGHDDYDAKTP